MSGSPPVPSQTALSSPGMALGKMDESGSLEASAVDASSSNAKQEQDDVQSPISHHTAPPTIEELEAMDRRNAKLEGDVECLTPAASSNSGGSKNSSNQASSRQYSRQVSRVSGTGRPASAVMPHAAKGTVGLARNRGALESPGGASPFVSRGPPHCDRPEAQSASRARVHVPRRSTSADEHGRRSRPPVRVPPASARGAGPGDSGWADRNGAGSTKAGSWRASPLSALSRDPGHNTNGNSNSSGLGREPSRRDMRNPHTWRSQHPGQGTPSGWRNKSRSIEGCQPASSSVKIQKHLDGETNPNSPKADFLREDGSAPKIRDAVEAVRVAEPAGKSVESPGDGGTSSSKESATCWGGGLPPAPNAVAQGPAATKAAAARATPKVIRYSEKKQLQHHQQAHKRHIQQRQPKHHNQKEKQQQEDHCRYPASDRESFARTLKDEELDELWQGLGEGVSQRGGGSEAAYEARPVPTSPAASGTFPTLTANVLERHDQLAEDRGTRKANVMPIPKDVGDKVVQDMENGRPAAKKGERSPELGLQSLLGATVMYGVLLLWLAHLVFNIFLLYDVVAGEYIWALCFLPGFLGITLSLNGCFCQRNGKCKAARANQRSARIGNGPHACALPAHVVLLLSMVVALGMHASALLFCEKDMELFFAKSTVMPLCHESSLLLPVVLDAVLLTVASLKASSLCWAWVLS